jgi:hypothetical protein
MPFKEAKDGPLPDDADKFKFFYLDGAVLNNKPFSSTIDAIFRRTSNRVVTRYLLYVDPDPERFKKPDPDPSKLLTPDMVHAASDALIGIPGYQSISGDLASIKHHNDLVKRYWGIFTAVKEYLENKSCIRPSARDFSSLDNCPAQRASYVSARLGQIRDRVVEGIIKKSGFNRPLDSEAKDAATQLVQSFRHFWDDALANPDESEIFDFDIYFRMRRLFYLTYRISFLLQSGKEVIEGGKKKLVPLDEDERGRYSQLWRHLNHHIKLLEMFQFAMGKTVDYADFPWMEPVKPPQEPDAPPPSVAEENWIKVRNLLAALLDTYREPLMDAAVKGLSEGEAKKQRLAVMACLSDRMKMLVNSDASFDKPTGNLLLKTDDLEWDVIRSFAPTGEGHTIADEYCNFLQLDAELFPMERLSGIKSLDQISVVRLSALDAQTGFSKLEMSKKVCGTQLAHFGGFMKSSWRANDLMWGRLDATCQLIETLITPDSLIQAGYGDRSLAPGAFHNFRRFPNSTPAQRKELLESMEMARHAIDEETVKNLKLNLIFAAQREIASEEIPVVLQEAINQQRTWNNYKIFRAPSLLLNRCWSWVVGVKQLDQAIVDYAAERLADEAKRAPGRWDKYMKETYAVGGEQWQTDIPKLVLIETFSKAVMGLREGLLTAAGKHADKIRANWLFKAFLVWPVNLLYRITRIQRTTPEIGDVALWVLAVALSTVLVVDCFFHNELFGISKKPSLDIQALLHWGVAPLVALIVVLYLIYLRLNDS